MPLLYNLLGAAFATIPAISCKKRKYLHTLSHRQLVARLKLMHTNEKYVARALLKLKIHETDGSAFETLFTNIMQYAHTDFVQIKPQGNKGDRSNDGYHPGVGHYYQVYAPENPADESKRGKAATKAAKDFKGLRAYWHEKNPIQRFSFVFNDKYKGSFPEIEAALKTIKDEHALAACESFRACNLEDKFFTLADDQIFAVVGTIPNPDTIQNLDYSLLNEVINAVHAASSTVTAASALNAPNFDDKIAFNGLGEHAATLLRFASYHVGALDAYFSLNSNFAKHTLRGELNRLYLDAKATTAPDHDGIIAHGDLIFFELLKRMTPRDGTAIQTAALVVMAYYFESCDVFDDPSNAKV